MFGTKHVKDNNIITIFKIFLGHLLVSLKWTHPSWVFLHASSLQMREAMRRRSPMLFPGCTLAGVLWQVKDSAGDEKVTLAVGWVKNHGTFL